MHEETINEPLRKVYALFEAGKIRPIALEWGKRRCKVLRVNSSWVDRSLRPHRYGFSLTMETGDIFQVSYEEGNPVWRLEYILSG
jgi:hypothetical protein